MILIPEPNGAIFFLILEIILRDVINGGSAGHNHTINGILVVGLILRTAGSVLKQNVNLFPNVLQVKIILEVRSDLLRIVHRTIDLNFSVVQVADVGVTVKRTGKGLSLILVLQEGDLVAGSANNLILDGDNGLQLAILVGDDGGLIFHLMEKGNLMIL